MTTSYEIRVAGCSLGYVDSLEEANECKEKLECIVIGTVEIVEADPGMFFPKEESKND
jgi:hypothetical protein